MSTRHERRDQKNAVLGWLAALDSSTEHEPIAVDHLPFDVVAPLDKHGNTALHHAAQIGHVTAVRLLAQHAATVDLLSECNVTPLYEAIEHKQTECAYALLDLGASANSLVEDAPSILYEACYQGLSDVVVRLVAAGANVDVTVEEDYTPLSLLSFLDTSIDIAPMVHALAGAGAVIKNPKRVSGWFERNAERMRLLMPNFFRPDDINPGSLIDNLPLLQLYLDHGGNPSVLCDNNIRLLCCMLKRGDWIGACYLAPFSDVNYMDQEGVWDDKCPLRAAIQNGVEVNVLQQLLAHGSPQPNEYYSQALKVAIREGRFFPEASFEYLASKVDITSTAFLADHAHLDPTTIARLLRLGANPNQRTADGYTPLFLAVQRNAEDAVELLAPLTADAISERHDGQLAVDVALQHGPNRHVLAALLRAGHSLPPNLPIDALYWHPANVGGDTVPKWRHGWDKNDIAYARLELQYMAVLSAVLDDPNWLKAPLPTTGLTPNGLALLHAEAAFLKTQELNGFTPSTARGVFFKDDQRIAILHKALQRQLAPLEATAQWHNHRLDVVDPAMYGAVYNHSQYSFKPHGGRLGMAAESVRHSDIQYYDLATVACPTQQFLPTAASWDAANGRATLHGYINNIPLSMRELYETLSDSLSLVLPLLCVAEGMRFEDKSPRIRLSKKAMRRAATVGDVQPELPSVKGFKFSSYYTSGGIPEPQRQVICSVQVYRTAPEILRMAPTSTTSTAWQRTSGAINEAVSQTALLFYDLVNVAARVEFAESFAAAQTCASPKDPTIEVHCRTRRGLQSQVTGVVSAHPNRLMFLANATAYRIVLSPIDANQPGYCKVLTWSFVSKDVDPLLSTAEVYPQQKHWFCNAVQGSRLATLPTFVLDHVLSFFGSPFLDDAEAQAIATASKAARSDVVAHSMGDVVVLETLQFQDSAPWMLAIEAPVDGR